MVFRNNQRGEEKKHMYIFTKVYLDEEYQNELVDMMIHQLVRRDFK